MKSCKESEGEGEEDLDVRQLRQKHGGRNSKAVRETSAFGESMMRLDFKPLREGGYVATSPDVPGLVAQGATIAQTVEIARDVARKIMESHLAHGDPIPMRRSPRRGRKLHALVPVTIVA